MSIKKNVNTKTEDGKDLVLIARTPTGQDLQKAQIESTKVFRTALEAGALLRSKLVEYMKEQKLWSDEMQKRLEETVKEINEKEKILKAGGIRRKDARQICIDIRNLRLEQAELLMSQRQYDLYTAESQAENAKFDMLVSLCVFDEEGNKYFKSVEDYKTRATEQAAADSDSILAELVNGYYPDWEKKLPENKFLIEHKFVDEEFRFIDKDGNLINEGGKRVNKDGRLINENGELVNDSGDKVDENGEVIVEFKPLLDDEEDGKVDAEEKQEVTAQVE